MSTPFDFQQLRAHIRDTLRPDFVGVMAREAGHGLYAVVLRTVDTAEILSAMVHTERELRKQMELAPNAPFPTEEEDDYLDYLCARWDHEEWRADLLNGEGTFRLDPFLEQFYATYGDTDDHFGGAAYAAMIRALQDLDREGVFGGGAAREAITLYCGSVDGDPRWLHPESALRLNPEPIAERFIEEWADGMGVSVSGRSGRQWATFLKWIDQEGS